MRVYLRQYPMSHPNLTKIPILPLIYIKFTKAFVDKMINVIGIDVLPRQLP